VSETLSRGPWRIGATIFVALLTVLSATPAVRATAPPTLPVAMGREFLDALSAGPISPGASGTLGFALSNPLPSSLTDVALTFEVYGFNGAPGTGSAALPTSAPSLSSGGASGPNVTLPIPLLGAHASGWSVPVTISVPSDAAQGTYTIRDSLSFDLNGSTYRLESVGYFAPALWEHATVLPNGTPTLNLTRLGVSGVLPETAVLVEDSAPLDTALYVLLGVAIVLGAAGGYVALRGKGPSSRSGRSSSPEESQADRTLGNKRSKAGD